MELPQRWSESKLQQCQLKVRVSVVGQGQLGVGWDLDPPAKTRSCSALLCAAGFYCQDYSCPGREQESKWWAKARDGNGDAGGGGTAVVVQ